MTVLAAAVLLAVAAALQWKKKAQRTVAVLAALAGIGFAIPVAGWLSTVTGTSIAGVAIGLPLTVFLCVVWYHEIHPKSGQPKRWFTPLVGFILPALLITTMGGPIGDLIHSGVTTVGNTGGRVVSQVTGKQ
jgi:hypothetical protein